MGRDSVAGEVDRAEIELDRQDANRILMALTIRRNELREEGYEENAEEYTELCQRIARTFVTERDV